MTKSAKILLANTNKQELSKHLKAIAYFSRAVYENMGFQCADNYQNMRIVCYLAGLFHDIGKVDPEYQDWVSEKIFGSENSSQQDIELANEKNWDRFVRHNEISWLLCQNIARTCSEKGVDILVENKPILTKNILYSVYWHHAEKIREDIEPTGKIFKELLGERWESIINSTNELLEELKLFSEYPIKIDLNSEVDIGETPPKFKTLDTSIDTSCSIARVCVIEADRIISSLSSDELNSLFCDDGKINEEAFGKILKENLNKQENLNSSLTESIKRKIDFLSNPKLNKDFDDDRNKKQTTTASELKDRLKDKNFVVLQGPAGVGKTLISLRTALECGVNKIVYICPRVQVCLQNYSSIISDIPSADIQIFTGEYKLKTSNGVESTIEENDFLNSEITITTIDQVASLFLNHVKATKLIKILSTDTLLVFDEFHELIKYPGLFPSFKEIVNLKRQSINKNENVVSGVLLMSATPNPIFLEEVFTLNEQDKINYKYIKEKMVKIPSFNEKNLYIKISSDLEEMKKPGNPGDIFIYNLINDLQFDALKNEERDNLVVFHSGFTPNDKKKIFEEVLLEFGKTSVGKEKKLILRAGPILQASLDISTNAMWTQETCPEDLLQRIGRCNRWGYLEESCFTIVKHKRNEKNDSVENSGQKKYLKNGYCLKTTLAFTKFLQEKKGDYFCIQINDLYDLYFSFIDEYKKEYESDIAEFVKEVSSIHKKNKFFRPVDFFSKKTKKKSVKLPKIGLRGASVYALPVKLIWNKEIKKLEYKKENNEYCWLWHPAKLAKDAENGVEIDQGNLLSLSRDEYFFKGQDSLLEKFQKAIKKKTCDARKLYPEDTYTKYNSKNTEDVLNRAQNPFAPILISDPEDSYKFGYGFANKSFQETNESQDSINENFAYDFEFDKNLSRYTGLGLVDVNKVFTFLTSQSRKKE